MSRSQGTVAPSGDRRSRVLSCPSCRGLWLHPDHLDNTSRAHLLDQQAPPPETVAEQDRQGGLCPEGHGILSRARIELEPPFYLDSCSTCEGVFFDAGEWKRLADQHLIDHIDQFWTEAWQKRQRQDLERRAYIQWAQELFGDELFGQLQALSDVLRGHPHRSEAFAFLRNESQPPDIDG